MKRRHRRITQTDFRIARDACLRDIANDIRSKPQHMLKVEDLNIMKYTKYSVSEKRLFEFILDRYPTSSEELTRKFYGKNAVPFHSRKIIIGMITSIQRKMDANKEPFRLVKSDPRGPYPINVWLEPRE